MKLEGKLVSSVRLACTVILLAAFAAFFGMGESASTSNLSPQAAAQPQSSDGSADGQKTLPAATPISTTWQKRWWIDKTARLLRGGVGLGPDENIEALLPLSVEEIARRFMRDPRFGDTILDFNMFFLGFKVNSLKTGGIYVSNAFELPNAVTSTQELLKGGDYLKLFDLEGKFFMAPLRSDPLDDPPLDEDLGLDPPQMRAKVIQEVKDVLGHLIKLGTARMPPAGNGYCKRIEEITTGKSDLTLRVFRAFSDAEIYAIMHGEALSAPFDALNHAVYEECHEKPAESADVNRLVSTIRNSLNQFNRPFAEILKHEPSVYEPKSVLEFRPFDLKAFTNTKKWIAFGFEQALTLQNSSTNFNRKRSAYVLKRFLCDDLTPVGFEDPEVHVGGAHGSDTSCYACHYKLDPMAGFFRNRGFHFSFFRNSSQITFDDRATTERNKYESIWRAPKGAPREWNVGYVRSPRFEEHNRYGETLSDLSRIIREAPESKRCLMKRLFEYMIAEDQTIDGGYLDYLTRQFEREAAVNSSEAMKNAIVRILQSETYRQRNAEPHKCYDSTPGAKPDTAPPCRVAFILQKNCTQCHNSTESGVATLDLGKWIPAPGGKSYTFPHLNDERKQIAAKDTLAEIIERVSSNDPAKRMPLNQVMSSQERQELFLWAQKEFARIAKGVGQ
jgi:hypothetical protein